MSQPTERVEAAANDCDPEYVEQCGVQRETAGGWTGFCFLPKGHDGNHMDVGI